MTLDQELARLTPWTAEHLMLLPPGEFARTDWLRARLHDSWVRRGLVEPLGRHDGRAWLYRIGKRGAELRDAISAGATPVRAPWEQAAA